MIYVWLDYLMGLVLTSIDILVSRERFMLIHKNFISYDEYGNEA